MNIDIAYIAMVFTAILLSMTLHEAMHGYAAYWLGDHTAKNEGRLSLNPIHHIDPFLTILLPLILALLHAPIFGGAKPVPFNPQAVRGGAYGAALVGLAGPLTNLVLSFILFAVYALLGTPTGLFGNFLEIAIVVNLGFFIFNMIPIPPLDGSRALYAVAPEPVQRFMEFLEQNGLIIVFAVVMLFSSQIGQIIFTAQQAIWRFYDALFGISVI
ncbi:MAG: site-2 protease family protein [Candidatus Saccharimonadales bacterium]|jgi:Zn-dependent protease